jgi:hypothetical protein
MLVMDFGCDLAGICIHYLLRSMACYPDLIASFSDVFIVDAILELCLSPIIRFKSSPRPCFQPR